MLVLTRKLGQTVAIGGTIRVIVLSVEPGRDGSVRIKLGFEAPHDVEIVREEAVYQTLKKPALREPPATAV